MAGWRVPGGGGGGGERRSTARSQSRPARGPHSAPPHTRTPSAPRAAMEHFIECVRRYPCLWNTTAIEYRDQELKDAAWAEVMKETELSSVKEVKLKWKKLRDSYRDALKRQSEAAASGAAGAPAKKSYAWKYTALMHFLQPYMNNRNKKPLENGHHAAPPAPPTPPTPSPPPDAEADSDDGSESSATPSAAMTAMAAAAGAAPGPVVAGAGRKRAASPDPLETFFTGMWQATRRLPFPAQLRIKRALFEAVAAGEEALLADHRRYAAALWPARGPHAAHAAAAGAAPASASSDDDAPDA